MPAKRPDSETNYDAFGTGSKLRNSESRCPCRIY